MSTKGALGVTGGEQRLTRTVKKAMNILDHLGQTGTSLTASEIGSHLRISRSTAYRLLTTLAAGGYVVQDPDSPEKYRLGPQVLRLAGQFLDQIELRREASPILRELRDLVNETVHLVVMVQGQLIYIDKEECSQAVRMHSTIGGRVFAHSTAVGKSMLAFMSADAISRIIDRHGLPALTPHTITDRQELVKELERIRQYGYAVDDIENENGIRCVGAPIFDHQRRPVAALSVSGPASRITLNRVSELATPVKTAALKISQRLGCPDSEHSKDLA